MSGRNEAVCSTRFKGEPSDKSKRQGRRMALLKRAGLFSNDTQGAEIIRATMLDDLIGAYRLVHDIYVVQGYIHPDETGIRIRPFDALPDTATFVAKTCDKVVGVTSVVIDSPEFGLPADKAFIAEVDVLRQDSRKICEGTNWLVADSHRNSSVMTELMRCCFAQAQSIECNELILAVSPGHVKFFCLLGFEQISPIRSFSKQIDDPVVLVRLDFDTLAPRAAVAETGDREDDAFFKSFYLDDNPYHRYIKNWQFLSNRFFADPTLLSELFVYLSGLLERCSAEERQAIERRWGSEVFSRVWSEDTVAALAG